MGRSRKLPQQRKHKKLKSVDPANHTAQRALKFKQNKHANQAPVDEDFQPAPRSFTDLMKRTRKLIAKKPKGLQKANSDYLEVVDGSVNQTPPRQSEPRPGKASSAKSRDADADKPPVGKDRKPVRSPDAGDIDRELSDGEPVFQRRRNESKWTFLQRMNRAAQTAMTKAAIESRFGVTLKNAGKGKVVAEADRDLLVENQDADTLRKPKNSTEATSKSVHVTKRKFKDVSTAEANKRSSRAEARRDYALSKRENEMFAPEAIVFGERNDRPPTLTATPRIRPKKPGEPVDFPLFDPSTMLTTPQKVKEKNDNETDAQKVQKLRVEQRRMTVVDQYRQLKKLKWQRQQSKPLVDDSPA